MRLVGSWCGVMKLCIGMFVLLSLRVVVCLCSVVICMFGRFGSVSLMLCSLSVLGSGSLCFMFGSV